MLKYVLPTLIKLCKLNNSNLVYIVISNRYLLKVIIQKVCRDFRIKDVVYEV